MKRDRGDGTDPWLALGPAHLARAVGVAGTVADHLVHVGLARMRGRVPPAPCDLVARLGPAFVKVAQVAATRGDVLPRSWCTSLADLHDCVPVDGAAAVPPDPRALGLPAGADVPVLLGAGSLATVWSVRLDDGSCVAVKQLRPGVRQRLATDLALMVAAATVLGRLPGLRGVPVGRMVGEIAHVAMDQTDLRGESVRLERLRSVLAPLPWAQVPAVRMAWSSERALVMDAVPARHRQPLLTPDLSASERRLLARRVLLAVYRMLFVDGFVHCDLHPGNLYSDATGNLVLLDAGFIVRLDDGTRLAFAQFFLALARGDGDRCARILQAAAADPDVAAATPTAAFRTEVAQLVRSVHGARTGTFQLAAFVAALFTLQRRHRVMCTPGFCFPLLTLLVVEETVRALDPEVDFQSLALPALGEAFGVDITRGPSTLFRAADLAATR